MKLRRKMQDRDKKNISGKEQEHTKLKNKNIKK